MTKEEIRANTSIHELLGKYGIKVRGDRCKCFVHNGDNYNMSIYRDKIVHCFVCGANLDCFGVVETLQKCDFREALKTLGGGIPVTPKVKLKARTNLMKQMQIDVAEKLYQKALEEWCCLDYIKTYYFQTKDTKVYRYYVWAMQHLSEYQQKLEESEARLFELRAKFR